MLLGFWWEPEARRCPRALLLESDVEAVSIVAAYDAWRRTEVLPFPGDAGAQPAWLMEAFATCDLGRQEAEAELRRRAEPPAGGGSRDVS